MAQAISQVPIEKSLREYWLTVEKFLGNKEFIRRQSTTDRPGGNCVELATFVCDRGVVIISVYIETAITGDPHSTTTYEVDVGMIIQGKVQDDQALVRELRAIEQIYLR